MVRCAFWSGTKTYIQVWVEYMRKYKSKVERLRWAIGLRKLNTVVITFHFLSLCLCLSVSLSLSSIFMPEVFPSLLCCMLLTIKSPQISVTHISPWKHPIFIGFSRTAEIENCGRRIERCAKMDLFRAPYLRQSFIY